MTLPKTMDDRLRNVILSMDATQIGYNEHVRLLLMECADLISTIADREHTDGLQGHRKNYAICRAIAKLKIRLEQSRHIWSRDNIDTFDRSMMREIEQSVRSKRKRDLPR